MALARRAASGYNASRVPTESPAQAGSSASDSKRRVTAAEGAAVAVVAALLACMCVEATVGMPRGRVRAPGREIAHRVRAVRLWTVSDPMLDYCKCSVSGAGSPSQVAVADAVVTCAQQHFPPFFAAPRTRTPAAAPAWPPPHHGAGLLTPVAPHTRSCRHHTWPYAPAAARPPHRSHPVDTACGDGE